ncbi:PA2169 family four-helix-bundle protein [Hymenobacter sp. BT175]|uniref:ferritin-like domain-containing protein n=1 Tax=Hymenobacter translucens TaxID=2886507 RepID=UPI001D0DDCC6|nr:PA2169 family four-helix-bundle protein [Hymenobacter translucens]MCC2547635.1 PA2169 family four-helix-bundle protein [Hymenobacter translucens]
MNQPEQSTHSGNNSSYTSGSAGYQGGSGRQNSDGSLLSKASQWLGKGSVGGLIGGMSTTQKVIGGALLVLGVGSLLRGKGSKAGTTTAAYDDQAATLHELLLFVNDRIEGYQRAVDESKDPERTGYYKQLVSQSQQFANELNKYLRQQGGGRETGTTVKGKLYRVWMDTKATLTGFSEEAILGSNIYGEEWAIKAYKDALSDGTLTGALRQSVERQYAQSQRTYAELQRMQGKA